MVELNIFAQFIWTAKHMDERRDEIMNKLIYEGIASYTYHQLNEPIVTVCD